MTTTNWRDRAMCAGRDVNDFDLEDREYRDNRAGIARMLCMGCPVKPECAQDALEFLDRGIVRAGIWIPVQHPSGARKQLEEIAERRGA